MKTTELQIIQKVLQTYPQDSDLCDKIVQEFTLKAEIIDITDMPVILRNDRSDLYFLVASTRNENKNTLYALQIRQNLFSFEPNFHYYPRLNKVNHSYIEYYATHYRLLDRDSLALLRYVTSD